MKLESYEIAEALKSRQIEVAVRLLLDHFCLPQPDALPDTSLISSDGVPRVLVWAGDEFFEWAANTGFDKGVHSYPLYGYASKPGIIDKVIIWS